MNDVKKWVEVDCAKSICVPNLFNSKIVGISFNDSTSEDQFKSINEKKEYIKNNIKRDDQLELIPKVAKWINPVNNELNIDEHALAVYHGAKHLGWIKQASSLLAKRLNTVIKAGYLVESIVSEVTGTDREDGNYGVNIELNLKDCKDD